MARVIRMQSRGAVVLIFVPTTAAAVSDMNECFIK